MDTVLLAFTAAAAAVILILTAVITALTVRQRGFAKKTESIEKKVNEFSEELRSEFERSRRELAGSQEQANRSTASSLEAMSGRIAQLKEDNTERQTRFERGVNKALLHIIHENAEQNEKQTAQISEALIQMAQTNEKKLDEIRNTVDEKLSRTLSDRLDSSFRTVSDRLESVYKSLGEVKELSGGVTVSVNTLNRVLTNVKARGTWAEVQLGAILDQILPGMYETNFAPYDGSSDRVEFAVRIPSGDGAVTFLPIDSKFPLEDYARLTEASQSGDTQALAAAKKALETRILNEAKSVSKYINVPRTTPFAVLYLATEGLYAEAYSSGALPEKIRTDYNVMIAGPSTVTALLNSLSLGFRAVAINEKASEITAVLAAARQQYEKFGDLLSKARRKIDEAGSALDEADRRNGIIRKKLGSVEELDGTDGQNNDMFSNN